MIPVKRSAATPAFAVAAPLDAAARRIAGGTQSFDDSIRLVDAELARMQVASERWITCKRSTYGPFCMTWDLGYACLDGRWGIALRVARWNVSDPAQQTVELWPLEQSPPYLRRRAITQLPALLDALVRRAGIAS